jgi:hypothetical protein
LSHENGGRTLLQNIRNGSPNDAASHPRRQDSSKTTLPLLAIKLHSSSQQYNHYNDLTITFTVTLIIILCTGVTDSNVTKEIISALCWQYNELYIITILQSIYLSTNEKGKAIYIFTENK